MPGTVMEPTAKSVSKRKRQEHGDESKKRRKSGGGESDDRKSQIKKLESEILESRKHYNNIVALVAFAKERSENPKHNLAAAEALCRVFISLLALGNLVRREDASEKEATVTAWLRDRLSEYHEALCAMMREEATAVKAMVLAMALVKAEALHMSDKGEAFFPQAFFSDLVAEILRSPFDQLREEFVDKFLNNYEDIRFYTLQAIPAILDGSDEDVKQSVQSNVFDLLVGLHNAPASSDDLEEFYVDPPKKKKHALLSLSQHKKRAQDAWLSLMQLGLDKEQKKKALEIMATSIAPWFTKPELLMDFLTDCYDSGGSTSLLALSGVFYLIQERNLDYPLFYTKLYSLLDADILHSKYRSRFFRLLDTFLASSHLPAVLVASFIKRLARLALNAPPSAIVAIVPWFYNIFKKHPLCTFMMHRVPRTKEERDRLETEGMDDPFLQDEEDPMETRAIDSCIWEIVQLQSHYHPNVATIAKIVSEQFTKQSYGLEDFLDHSYGSLLEAETAKEVKKPPVVEYMIPKRIFTKTDSIEEKDSLLVSLWDFGSS
ncbi:CBF/Mak21 family-domain-containing protein [Echria macrotheca]|uniref:CBF/Mak21 family-domain-containing protein n=1 Tax=Echria macrotheca TaxID=438768 RepID=A0AAJ0F7Q3_9PEZI|nr:CBF/Mak21 family-domain-containing protein [Echria macrotheca]